MPELLLKANHRRPLSSLVCRNSESAANRELDLELLVGRLHTKIITLWLLYHWLLYTWGCEPLLHATSIRVFMIINQITVQNPGNKDLNK